MYILKVAPALKAARKLLEVEFQVKLESATVCEALDRGQSTVIATIQICESVQSL